jgi:hypothetical protein
VRAEFELVLRDLVERTQDAAQGAVNKPLTDLGRIKNGPLRDWGKAGVPMAQRAPVLENGLTDLQRSLRLQKIRKTGQIQRTSKYMKMKSERRLIA